MPIREFMHAYGLTLTCFIDFILPTLLRRYCPPSQVIVTVPATLDERNHARMYNTVGR